MYMQKQGINFKITKMEFCTVNTGLGTSYVTVPDPSVESIRSPLRKGVSGGDDGTRYTLKVGFTATTVTKYHHSTE
jgi:hypothetical protein